MPKVSTFRSGVMLVVLGCAMSVAMPAGAQTVELLSGSTTAGKSGDGPSTNTSVSRDGRWTVFQSAASDLISGIPRFSSHIYLHDAQTGALSLVSHHHADANLPANGGSQYPVISGDGNWIVFLSGATDLLPGFVFGGGSVQAYVYNRQTGRAGLVSRNYQVGTTGSGAGLNAGVAPLGGCGGYSLAGMSAPSISYDGARIAFISCAIDLVFNTIATPLDIYFPYTVPHAYLFTRTSAGDATTAPQGTVMLVDPAVDGEGRISGDPRSYGMTPAVTVSGDGNWVSFATDSLDVFAGVTDANGTLVDVGLLDVAQNQRRLLSRNYQTPTDSANAASNFFGNAGLPISYDGTKTVFLSYATDLIQNQSNPAQSVQLWVYDRSSDSVTLVTHAAGSTTSGGDRQQGIVASLSDNGRYLVFGSDATNLLATATSTRYKVFLYDTSTRVTSLVSHGAGSTAECYDPGSGSLVSSVSPNGDRVAFLSTCQGVDGTANQNTWGPGMGWVSQLYLWERATSTSRLVTRNGYYSGFTAYSAWGGHLPTFGSPMDASGHVLVFGSVSTEMVYPVTDGNDNYLLDRRGLDAYRHVVPPPPTLTVDVSGNGTVTSSPAGINCGVDCSEVYALDTLVTLTAVAADGYQFDQWTGDCEATGHVTMNAPKTCTATFVVIPPADLEVTGSAASATVPRAGTAVITFTVTNWGPATSTAAVATFQPPAKGTVTLPSACKKGKGKGAAITCSLGNLAPGANVPLVFSISYRASQTGTFSVGLSVTSSTPDQNLANNAFSVSFLVGG